MFATAASTSTLQLAVQVKPSVLTFKNSNLLSCSIFCPSLLSPTSQSFTCCLLAANRAHFQKLLCDIIYQKMFVYLLIALCVIQVSANSTFNIHTPKYLTQVALIAPIDFQHMRPLSLTSNNASFALRLTHSVLYHNNLYF